MWGCAMHPSDRGNAYPCYHSRHVCLSVLQVLCPCVSLAGALESSPALGHETWTTFCVNLTSHECVHMQTSEVWRGAGEEGVCWPLGVREWVLYMCVCASS
jgi:hypothetical protein